MIWQLLAAPFVPLVSDIFIAQGFISQSHSWPDRMPRFFGEFETEAEAARWIREHSWLAPDNAESADIPDPKAPAGTD